MGLELTLLALVWLLGLTAVHRVAPASVRPQRAQHPGCCSSDSSGVRAGPS
jgi:hypothetical protein